MEAIISKYSLPSKIMKQTHTSQLEFIALMASLMSLVALAMDALLPALGNIGLAIGTLKTTDQQLLITMIFLGLGLGQLIAGPLSDSFGRKPVIYYGFLLFILASFLCVSADSLELMIVGRILQGIGLSAPKTISVAIVRDSYSGDYMAKIMSFVIVIFISVPAIAPALGKYLLDHWGWTSIFYTQIVMAVIVLIWFGMRQAETLKNEYKVHFNMQRLSEGVKEFFKYKQTVVNTIILGFITGAFLVFLSTAQIIFTEQYQMPEEFPYLFAAIAASVGISTLLNGLWVVRMGMEKLIYISTALFTLIALIYVVLFFQTENPSVYVLLSFLVIQFFTFGFLFGNISALAMQPIGHMAGMGSALNGFISTVMAVPIAAVIGQFIKHSALPLFIGFMVSGLIALTLMVVFGITQKTTLKS